MESGWKSRVRALLKERGMTMKAASLAAGQGETFVRDILERDRDPGVSNLAALAHVLGTTAADLLAYRAADERQHIPIMGYVGAGGDVDPDYEQVPFDGLAQVELPYIIGIIGDPIGFEVRGESMQPKYGDGEVVVVEREQPASTDSMIGDFAVVRTYDGHRYVKKIMPGRKAHTFNLVSINAPTIEGARIEWASPVRLVIPNVGLRHVRHTRKPASPARRPKAPGP
jgi:transcriptional regulator with XRE-family HTH domain